MKSQIRVLLIEDNEGDVLLIKKMLTGAQMASFVVETADNLVAGLRLLDRGESEVLLLDLGLPESRGLATLGTVVSHPHDCPIIVLTGLADHEAGIRAVHEGAQDFLIKGQVNSEMLERAILYAIERQRLEQTIKNSERRLLDITATVAEGIYVMNEHGHIIFLNPEAERLLGYNLEELAGKNAHDLIHCQRPDGSVLSLADCLIHRTITSGVRCSSDHEMFRNKAGQTFPVEVHANPVVKDSGNIATVVAFRDISIRKQKEAEREKLVQELQEALAQVKTLSGMLPICSYCKKIRDDKGYWEQLESYITKHSEALFSHGCCPECYKKAVREIEEYTKKKGTSG